MRYASKKIPSRTPKKQPGDSGGIVIRHCHGLHEFELCIQVERAVWQSADIDVVPIPLFVVASEIGGQVLGAFDDDALVGFTLALVGWRNRKTFLHSHMTAVLDAYRDRKIGQRLKLFQRQDALARGIDLIEWTFDPMQGKNAFLNLEKLGAIVRRYSPDFYGQSESPLHGSLPTDRLHAEWWLKSKRVESIVAGQTLPEFPIKGSITVTNSRSSSNETNHHAASFGLESLLRVRREFLTAFANGLTGLRFQKDADGQASYLLGAWDEDHS
jgi:predicted GNAT superfamily acetyltransferase